MPKLTKKRKKNPTYDVSGLYSLNEAMGLLEKSPKYKFDESVDIAVKLNLQSQKGEQVRGVVSLPHGNGKTPKVLVICDATKEQEAKEAGADYVGEKEYLNKISQGWLDFDVLVATPSMMPSIGKLGRILGPSGKMPSPKEGTVTPQVGLAVEGIKKGRIAVKTDKFNTIQASIGRRSFSAQQLTDNVNEFIQTVLRLKPRTAKSNYLERVALSTTMGIGVKLDKNQIGKKDSI